MACAQVFVLSNVFVGLDGVPINGSVFYDRGGCNREPEVRRGTPLGVPTLVFQQYDVWVYPCLPFNSMKYVFTHTCLPTLCSMGVPIIHRLLAGRLCAHSPASSGSWLGCVGTVSLPALTPGWAVRDRGLSFAAAVAYFLFAVGCLAPPPLQRDYERGGVRVRRVKAAFNLAYRQGTGVFHGLIESLPQFFVLAPFLRAMPHVPLLSSQAQVRTRCTPWYLEFISA